MIQLFLSLAVLVAGGGAVSPAVEQAGLSVADAAQRKLFTALDGSTYMDPQALSQTVVRYEGLPSTGCYTRYRVTRPAHVTAGGPQPALNAIQAINWREVVRVAIEPSSATKVRIERRSATQWLTFPDPQRRSAFFAAATTLSGACLLPEPGANQRSLTLLGERGYRCQFWTPGDLTLTRRDDGTAEARFEREQSFANGRAVFSAVMVRHPGGRTELSELQIRLYRDGLDGSQNPRTSTLMVDGVALPGWPAGARRSEWPNAAGQYDYFIDINLQQGGEALLTRLEGATTVTFGLYNGDGSVGMPQIKASTWGLGQVRPFLRRTAWSCFEPAGK